MTTQSIDHERHPMMYIGANHAQDATIRPSYDDTFDFTVDCNGQPVTITSKAIEALSRRLELARGVCL